MGKDAPPMPDYTGAARQQGQDARDLATQQTRANRPNITTPYAYQQWSEGPDGQWTMSTGFTGETAQLADRLRAQSATAMSQPFDLGAFGAQPQFGNVGTGDSARQQAVEAAYGQATSRLDPMWKQREEGTRTRLLNQGLSEGSEAWNNAMGDLGRERNDAYSSAMSAAIAQGTAAGDSAFRNNLAGEQARFTNASMARQQAIADALRARGLPMEELGALQRNLAMPAFQGAGRGETPRTFDATAAAGQYGLDAWGASNAANADAWGTAFEALGTIASIYATSDVRAKRDVQYLEEEALPGVKYATFEYLHEPGQRYRGVIAQDVRADYPHLVITGEDGLLRVHPAFAPEPLA